MFQSRGVRSEILHSQDGEPPSAFMSSLSAVENRAIVRITGGCAEMSAEDADGLMTLFREAFAGFGGALLIGGTSMVSGEDMSDVIPGITEVGPEIRKNNPSSVLLGVVGRADSLSWDFTNGKFVIERSKITDPADSSGSAISTIIHPHMDAVVILGKRLTKLSIWHDEAVFCARVTEAQRHYAQWKSALVVYNGGGTTEFEARLVAKEGWPVVLIRGSGRAADKLAADHEFLDQHPQVTVCEKDVLNLRHGLIQTGTIDPAPAGKRLRAMS